LADLFAQKGSCMSRLFLRHLAAVITTALVLLLAAPAARAQTVEEQTVDEQTVEEQIVAALELQGYVIISMERTWLGRLRVLAEDDRVRRELVFNPGTGEILRDFSIGLALLRRDDRDARRDRRDDHDDDGGRVTATQAPQTVTADDQPMPGVTGLMSDSATIDIPDALLSLDPE